MLNLLKVKATRKFLTKRASLKAVIVLVTLHLDYANSILVGLPTLALNNYKRVQNIAAKIVLGRSKYESSPKCLVELHWLPIQYRINFKVVTPVFRCIHKHAPSYLQELIILKKPRRQGLRLQDLTRQPEIPQTSRHTFAARSFRVKDPTIWNQLPEHIRKIEDYSTVNKHVKPFVKTLCLLYIFKLT